MRQGLKILIRTDPLIEIAGEAKDGDQAVEIAQSANPDVVVMDLAMPRLNGLEATRQILENCPAAKVLILSSYGDHDSVEALIAAGASGYITKHSASDDLLQGIRQVSGGRTYLSPRIASALRRRKRNAFLKGAGVARSLKLSARESEVLKLIGEGLASKERAARLGWSVKPVEKHRQAVMDKLDIHEVAGLTRYAAEKGLLGVPSLLQA